MTQEATGNMTQNNERYPEQSRTLGWWTTGALLLLIPSVFNAFLIDAFNLTKITLFRLAIVALAGIWLWRTEATGKGLLRRTSLDIPVIAFFAAALLSTIFSINGFHSFFGQHMYHTEGFLAVISFTAFFFLLVSLLTQDDMERLMPVVVIASVPVLLYGLLQACKIDFVNWQNVSSRIPSSLGNPNFLGGYIVMIMPFFFAYGIKWNGLRRWGVYLLAALALWCLLNSFSRAALLGTIISCAAFFYLTGTGKVRKVLARFLIIATVIVAAVVTVHLAGTARSDTEPLNASTNVFARFWNRVDLNDLNVQVRARYLAIAGRMFTQHPVLGFGPDTFSIIWRRYMTVDLIPLIGGNPLANPGYAHSELFQVMATQGIVGLLAYLWLLISLVRSGCAAASSARTKTLKAAATAALLGTFVNNQFSFFSPSTAVYFWFLAAFIATGSESAGKQITIKNYRVLSVFAGVLLLVIAFYSVKAYRAEAYFPKGLFLEAKGRLDESINYYTKAVTAFPYEQTYYQNLGKAFIARAAATSDPAQKTVFLQASVRTYRKHLSLVPQDALSWNGLGIAYLNLALIHKSSSDFDNAGEAFRRSMKEAPVFLEPHINLATVLYTRNRKQEAMEIFGQALDINPREPLIYLNLGNIAAQEGNLRKAVTYWQDALDLDPRYEQARININEIQKGGEANHNQAAIRRSELTEK